jgi:hypothetical protein
MISTWVPIFTLLVAVSGGIWIGRLWNEHTVISSNETHKREMDVIWEEVKRLRAQVADLIGK